MAQREPVLIVFKPTAVRRPDGRVVILRPGLKSDTVTQRIKSIVSRSQLEQMRKGGRIAEDTPPWREDT